MKKTLFAFTFIVLTNLTYAQRATIESLYSTIKEKNTDGYKKLFSDSSYLMTGRRLSLMRNKNAINIKVDEIKSNNKNGRGYSIFRITYYDRYYPKYDTLMLLSLHKEFGNEWKIEELCENINNKGELYTNGLVDKNFSIEESLYITAISDSVAVELMVEREEDPIAFDKKYKIFENSDWFNKFWKEKNTDIKELKHSATSARFEHKLKRGYVEFVFTKEDGSASLPIYIFFKKNNDGKVEIYTTDGRKKESNLFK